MAPTKLVDAVRAAFAAIRERAGDDTLYVYALDLRLDGTLLALANSEKRGRDPRTRWEASRFAHRVRVAVRGDVYGELCGVLQQLDGEGVFGRGRVRAAVALLLLAEDISNSELVLNASLLNRSGVWRKVEKAFPTLEPAGAKFRKLGVGAYSFDTLSLSADGSVLVALGWFNGDGAFAWRLRGSKLVLRRREWNDLRYLSASGAGGGAGGVVGLVGADEQVVRRFEILPGKLRGRELPAIDVTGDEVVGFAATREGARAAVMSTKGKRGVLELFDVATGARLARRAGAFEPLAFSADGRTLAVGGRTLAMLDGMTLATRAEHADLGARHVLAFSPDGKRYVIAEQIDRGRIGLRTTTRGATTVELRCQRGVGASAVAFAPDGRHFAVAYDDGWLRCFDLRGRVVLEGRGHHEAMNACVFLTSRTVAVVGRDVHKGGSPVLLFDLR